MTNEKKKAVKTVGFTIKEILDMAGPLTGINSMDFGGLKNMKMFFMMKGFSEAVDSYNESKKKLEKSFFEFDPETGQPARKRIVEDGMAKFILVTKEPNGLTQFEKELETMQEQVVQIQVCKIKTSEILAYEKKNKDNKDYAPFVTGFYVALERLIEFDTD